MDDQQRDQLVRRLETQAVAMRRRALATGWSLVDAEALLRVAPSLEHVDLCVQSCMIEQCTELKATLEELEETIAFALGRIASWSSLEALDTVLTQHVPWLRVLELAWLCGSHAFVQLILRDVLCDEADSVLAAAKSLDT
jgi:hypothetical protein